MKTILQTFALLILLFAASTYSQEDIALENNEGSIAIETKVPDETLVAVLGGKVELEGETNSSTLPSQETPIEDIEVNSPDSPKQKEETPVTIPKIQESISTVESPKETPLTVADEENQEPKAEAVNLPENPQKEEDISATIPDIQDSTSNQISLTELSSKSPTPQTVEESPTLSESEPEVQVVNSSNSPQKEEDILVTNPDIQESTSNQVSKLESSTEIPEDTPQIVDEEPTLSESEPEVKVVTSSNSPQKEEDISVTNLDIQESTSNQVSKSESSTKKPEDTPEIVNEEATLSESEPEVPVVTSSDSPQKGEAETPVTIPDFQESSSIVSKLESSTNIPEETSQIENKTTTLSESEPEVQAQSESTSEREQSLDTIICVCNCGINSDLPQKCEESLSEKNISPTESTNKPLAPEIEKEAENEEIGNIETETPSGERETISTSDTSIVNEESTVPIVTETETVSTQEIESSNATPTINAPQEEAGLIVNNESTTVTAEIPTSSVTESKPELNIETTSYLWNPLNESTEANHLVSSESEPTNTNNPLEVSSTTINPCTEVGDFPHPNNCRQFVSCSGNATSLISQELQCPERSAFNSLVRRCTRDLSSCLDEEPICLKTSSIPNPNGDNSSYFWCVPNLLGGFHKYHIKCSKNEIFVPLLGRCWLEIPQLGLGFGLINREPSDRDLVRAEWKLLKREIKLKAKEEKLRKKIEEKAKARAEKLAAKELKKQKGVVRKVDDDDSDKEDDD